MNREELITSCKNSPTPASMYVMGMCSDAQEMLCSGMVKEAISLLNDIKILTDEFLAEKDEYGRHTHKK